MSGKKGSVDIAHPSHASVMLAEVSEALGGLEEGVIVDGTVGQGGHCEALLRRTGPRVLALALDRDPFALEAAKARLAPYLDRIRFFHRGYEETREVLDEVGLAWAHRILLDLGLSSAQLDSDRGFSVQRDAPLDMRFDPTSADETAADVLRRISEAELASHMAAIGQVPAARKLARTLKTLARAGRMRGMKDLREACREVLGPRVRRMDSAILPAMVLRILVNRELERLASFLDSLPSVLAPSGKVAILTYHSGEDRLVKQAFRGLAAKEGWTISFPKGLRPGADEVSCNPRARAARLRMIERDKGS